MSETMIVTTLAAGQSARRRLVSALARGVPIVGVFFLSDGIEAAAATEERKAWQALAQRHGVALWLCATSAERRGFDVAASAPSGFAYAAIADFAALADQAEHVDVAGR